MNLRQNVPLDVPIRPGDAAFLRAGDTVLLSGTLYTARDAAHARLAALLREGKPLPFDPVGAVVYYVGPTPAKPGQIIGSAGPTTSSRMDTYTPALLQQGLWGMIGKGNRSREVIDSIKAHGAVYFGAIGGGGALLSKCITTSAVVCYEDLGTEAVRRLTVRSFPVTVVIDSTGDNLYEIGKNKYKQSLDKGNGYA